MLSKLNLAAISPELEKTKRAVGLGGMAADPNAFDPEQHDPEDPNSWMKQVKPVGNYGWGGLASLGEGMHNAWVMSKAEQARGEQRASQSAANRLFGDFAANGGMASGPAALAKLMAHPGTRQFGVQAYTADMAERRAEARDGRLDARAEARDERTYQRNKMLADEANDRQLNDPLRQMQIAETTAQTAERIARAKKLEAEGNRSPAAIIEERRAQAAAAGLKEDDPGFQSFLLTGKMPREDQQPLTATDKKAIIEADDDRLKAAEAASTARTALGLNDKTYFGPTAHIRGRIMAFFGNENGVNTSQFRDLVGQLTLESLKPTFGGNPTEGERTALMDLQASVSKTPEERKRAMSKVLGMLERREQLARAQSEGIRDKTYYKPGYAPKMAPQAPPVKVVSPEDAKRLPSGTVFVTPDGRTMQVP
jgi:hypothetical protein